eukprot:m.300413 g.300413  ORF g.300413 m.300413 type:complete len:439 (+) comp40798_c0_seq6:1981-3297(+)
MKSDAQALFMLDPLLARAVLYSTKLDDFSDWVNLVHPSEFLVSFVKRIESLGPYTVRSAIVLKFVALLAAKLTETSIDTDVEKAEGLLNCGIYGSSQLLFIVSTRFSIRSQLGLIQKTLELTFAQLTVISRMAKAGFDVKALEAKRKKPARSEQKLEDEVLGKAGRNVSDWLLRSSDTHPTAETLRNDIDAWDCLLSAAKGCEAELVISWSTLLEKHLMDQLSKNDGEGILQTYSLMGDAEFHPVIDKCFASMTERALEKLTNSKEDQEIAFKSLMTSANSNVNTRKADHSRRLLTKLLVKNTPEPAAINRDWLHSLMTWPLWQPFLRSSGQLFTGSESVGNIKQTLTRAESVLVLFVEKLESAEVLVEDYRYADRNRQRLLGLCSLVDERKSDTQLKDQASRALALRREELRLFEKEQSLVLGFVDVCCLLGRVTLN